MAFLGLSFWAGSQNPESNIRAFDRSQAPTPGPTPKIEIGSYESFILPNGLEVFVIEDKESARVSFQLSMLKHGRIVEGENAGIGSVTAELLENGTRQRKAAQIEDEVDFMAATLVSFDGGMFASSLKKYQNDLLEIMSDILLNPAFPEDKLTKIKKRTISNLLTDQDDPNSIASKVTRNVNYPKDHPYRESVSASSVSNIDLKECIDYYKKYYKSNSAYLVMVGNIDLHEAKEVANNYFGKWQKGEVTKNINIGKGIDPDKTKIMLSDRPSSKQSVIRITYAVNDLKPGGSEEISASVMNSILGGGSARLFDNLREDKGYTYGAYSSLSRGEFVGNFSATASVRNEVTGESIKELLYEMDRIKNEKVSEEELQFTLNKMAGSFSRSLENPQTVANFATTIRRFDLPSDYYEKYLNRLGEVSVDDVHRAANKYIRPENANIVVVGKGDEIRSQLEPYGEIVEFKKTGEEIVSVNLEDLSIDDITPEEIIAKYSEAVGGEKMKKINSIIISSSSASGEINMLRKGWGKAVNSMISGDKRVFQVTLNGGKASSASSQGARTIDPLAIEKLVYSTRIHEEIYYGDSKWNVKMKLKDIVEVDGKACYKMFVTLPSNDRVTKFYDVVSGLLIKEQSAFKGTITYDDYKAVDGILFPHSFSVERSQMYGSYSAVVTKIQLNPEISDFIFKVF